MHKARNQMKKGGARGWAATTGAYGAIDSKLPL